MVPYARVLTVVLALLAGCAVEGRVTEMVNTVVPLKRGDIDTLARTLYGEARGEGVSGMQAVAWVIVNRAKRGGRFPITIAGVCKQPQQFTCWSPNDINAKVCAAVDESDPSFAQAVYAAASVLTGEVPDFTGSADHYYASSMKVAPSWAGKMTHTVRIGNHRFFREH
jgi:spore germination cell wall hydrolase CwlJ-like protein